MMPKRLVYHVMAYLNVFRPTMFPGKMALLELPTVRDFRDAKTSRLSCDGLLKCVYNVSEKNAAHIALDCQRLP